MGSVGISDPSDHQLMHAPKYNYILNVLSLSHTSTATGVDWGERGGGSVGTGVTISSC